LSQFGQQQKKRTLFTSIPVSKGDRGNKQTNEKTLFASIFNFFYSIFLIPGNLVDEPRGHGFGAIQEEKSDRRLRSKKK
jgi:hypothetical protein